MNRNRRERRWADGEQWEANRAARRTYVPCAGCGRDIHGSRLLCRECQVQANGEEQAFAEDRAA